MKFTKMHGCGNDYVYVNLFEEKIADPAKVSIAVSDRHFGQRRIIFRSRLFGG